MVPVPHVHLNLAGFMSMVIFDVGVGYQNFPRFSGRPLYSRRVMTAIFRSSNAGVLGLPVGFCRGSTRGRIDLWDNRGPGGAGLRGGFPLHIRRTWGGGLGAWRPLAGAAAQHSAARRCVR